MCVCRYKMTTIEKLLSRIRNDTDMRKNTHIKDIIGVVQLPPMPTTDYTSLFGYHGCTVLQGTLYKQSC